jgi:hypothetical protein
MGVILDGAERYLETHVARLLLSTLILLSLLPLDELLQHAFALHPSTLPKSVLDLIFFCVFAPEFGVRLIVHLRRRRLGDQTFGETFLLSLDLLATLSFLPVWSFMSLSALRLVRLTRMVLLLGYWGGMLADLLRVLGRRERRFQVCS